MSPSRGVAAKRHEPFTCHGGGAASPVNTRRFLMSRIGTCSPNVKARKTPARHIALVFAPHDRHEGYGAVEIAVGKETACYLLKSIPCDLGDGLRPVRWAGGRQCSCWAYSAWVGVSGRRQVSRVHRQEDLAICSRRRTKPTRSSTAATWASTLPREAVTAAPGKTVAAVASPAHCAQSSCSMRPIGRRHRARPSSYRTA